MTHSSPWPLAGGLFYPSLPHFSQFISQQRYYPACTAVCTDINLFFFAYLSSRAPVTELQRATRLKAAPRARRWWRNTGWLTASALAGTPTPDQCPCSSRSAKWSPPASTSLTLGRTVCVCIRVGFMSMGHLAWVHTCKVHRKFMA